MFEEVYLRGIKASGKVLHGNCNTWTTTADKTGSYGDISMWINKRGVANLLSLNQTDLDGCRVTYDTFKVWVLHVSDRTKIFFKRDTDIYDRMPYIDMHIIQAGFAMLQTVRNKFEGFIKKKI